MESFNGKQCDAGTKKVVRSIDYAPDGRLAAPPFLPSVDGACIDGLDWDGSPSSAVHPSVPPWCIALLAYTPWTVEPSGHLSPAPSAGLLSPFC